MSNERVRIGGELKAAKFLGSMSNVGARISCEQNSGSKGSEVSKAESNALQGFDSIVAALRKTVGQVNVESVQDVGSPVAEHLATGIKLRQIQTVAGIQPEIQFAVGFGTAGSSHKVVKRLLEGIRLQKLFGETKHYIHSGAIFLCEPVAMGEQQLS